MKYLRINLSILLASLTIILLPAFALISFSQTNDTLSDDAFSDDQSSNDTFSSWSRELANNQSDSDVESEEDDE